MLEAGKMNLRVSFGGGTGKELDQICLHRCGGETKDQGVWWGLAGTWELKSED